MSVYADESAEVCNERRVRARKEHRCGACGLTIRRGDTYVRDAMLYDGSWDVVLRCERCELIYEHVSGMMTDSDEFCARELDCGHEFVERWGMAPPAWLAALAFWLPGDPLPATNRCTQLSTWRSPAKWLAPACTKDVAGCNSWGPWSVRGAESCRTNRIASHREACS